jgi:hypothetical protein
MRRAVLVTFCLSLLGTVSVVFTRVIAARVPEQRATLEKLIADRTGLAVRFDNVHFAWNLDGTSAVFERVELTDPKRGRVRVVAPELRVEFDTWDYLRHHQFSLGHVTLSSPDIEIVGEPEPPAVAAGAQRGGKASRSTQARDDEAALIRRFTAWAELMPNGRVEVEGARIHLVRRGDRAAHDSFTLSQAVLSRGATSFSAFGTMLLSQDVGQSLFLSVKIEGLGSPARVSGDLRVIARRVFLDRLPVLDAEGRGTLDATVRLKNGLIQSASWQASARDLEIGDDAPARFDHFTVNGQLERDAGDFILKFADLQLTRGARLERSPNVIARLRLKPGTTQIARTTLTADRVPFMAAEFIAGLFAPQLDERMLDLPGGWAPTAGVLRGLTFDSQARTLSAQLSGAEFVRASDHARIGQLAARVFVDDEELRIDFDPAETTTLRLPGEHEPRAFRLSGEFAVLNQALPASFRFDAFDVRTGDSAFTAQGEWSVPARSLQIEFAQLDHALLRDAWTLLAPESETPALIADIERGSVAEGKATLHPARDAAGQRVVNWQRSSGSLKLEALATSGRELPRVEAGSGTLAFARGSTQLTLDAGTLEQLAVTSARFDWPRKGEPRLHAALRGDLSSPLLREALAAQGLERLAGSVILEADARGDKELRQPDLWRVNARISNASVPLGGGLPPLEKLAGSVRYGNGSLRSLALEGRWLGGPVTIESRRTNPRGALNVNVNGVAEAVPLLQLLGQADVASRVNGQIAWAGSAQRIAGSDNGWQLALTSSLAGVESRLPDPFDKPRARSMPVSAQLRVDADGIHDFSVEGRGVAIHGLTENGEMTARFELQGVAGELRRTGSSGDARLHFERLDVKRAPAVLSAAGALLPVEGEIEMTIDDLRHAGQSLGPLHANLRQRDQGVAFSLESTESAPHQLVANGSCEGAGGECRLDFTADTRNLAAWLRGAQIPAEWPTEALHAAGELRWPADARGDLTPVLSGRFDLETEGRDSTHQMSANASIGGGQIQLTHVQGTGPETDQLFRGSGRVGLTARDYDLTIDYERVSLAASAMPTPARARLARAWTALRGTAARRGWTEVPETRRVQWHGTWDAQD